MRRALRLGPLMLALLVAACGESPSDPLQVEAGQRSVRERAVSFEVTVKENGRTRRYTARAVPGRRHLELQSLAVSPPDECLVGDPSCQACPLDDPECWQAETISGESSVYVEEPWDGSIVGEAETGPYICPSYADSPRFTWRTHAFDRSLAGVRIYKVASLPAYSGIPRARYQIPPGYYLSDDGRARFTAGTVDASCFVTQQVLFGFLRVTSGWMTYGSFRGDMGLVGGGGGESFVSFTSGGSLKDLPQDAQRVLEVYFTTGQCTDGWVIIIDNQRVC